VAETQFRYLFGNHGHQPQWKADLAALLLAKNDVFSKGHYKLQWRIRPLTYSNYDGYFRCPQCYEQIEVQNQPTCDCHRECVWIPTRDRVSKHRAHAFRWCRVKAGGANVVSLLSDDGRLNEKCN
jgi:hypothetical protein